MKADLKKMGCEGFLLQPWTLKSREMVQEFLQPRSNKWEGTIRRLPDKWTVDSWAEVYGFRKDGRTVAGRIDRWINGKFRSPINSKDGHFVEDCVDPREHRILEFVVPIIYSEKPKQVTKVVGNTIFGSLFGEYLVNWDQVIQEVVGRLVSHLEKGKPSPISLYLFHLYSRNECMNDEEIDEIEAARKYLEFGVSSEIVMLSEEEGSEHRSPSPRGKTQAAGTSSSGRLKHTYQSPEGSPKIQNPDWRSMMTSKSDPFQRVFDDLEQLRLQYHNLDTITARASKLLGDCKVGNIEKELKKLKAVDTKPLEDKIVDLTVTLAVRNDEVEDIRKQVKSFELLKQAIGVPGDVINKAQ